MRCCNNNLICKNIVKLSQTTFRSENLPLLSKLVMTAEIMRILPDKRTSTGCHEARRDDDERKEIVINPHSDVQVHVMSSTFGALLETINNCLIFHMFYSRLVFTNDGVGVGVRSSERYNLVKIKPVRRNRKKDIDGAYDSVAYDLVKTRLLEW